MDSRNYGPPKHLVERFRALRPVLQKLVLSRSAHTGQLDDLLISPETVTCRV